MNTRELVQDTTKRALAKYHNAFIKALQTNLNNLEDRVETVEKSSLNIIELSSTEIENIINNN